MANTSYLGSNVVTTDSFAGWIEKTNRIIYAMGTEVITIAGNNTGNVAITGAITANTVAVGQYLRGGNNTSNTALTVTSNTTFSGDLISITAANTTVGSSGANVLNINSIVAAVSNVTISGGLTNITSTNTTIGNVGSEILNVKSIFAATSNATFSGSLVNITAANTTVGGTAFNVNANTDFNGTVNIDGITTVTANTTFSGALLNITSSNVTIGDAGTDALNINAVADFNANVQVDGIITVNGNAVFSNIAINGSTTIGDLASDTLTINAILNSDIIPIDNTIDLGSVANTFGNAHATTVYTKDLSVSNSATVANVITINTQANTASLMVRDLTATRITYAGVGGELVDSANLTFTGTNLNIIGTANVTSNANVGGALGVTGAITASNTLSVTGLTTLSTANVTSNANVGGTLGITGALTAASTLGVTGAITASNTLSVTGLISASANIALIGTGARTISTNSSSSAIGSINLVIANTTTSNTVLVANTTGIHSSANIVHDLGSTTTYWKTLYVRDAVVANSMTFSAANITSSANIGGTLSVTGVTTLSANLDLGDNKQIRLGDSQDFTIYHDGLNSYIKDSGTGNLKVVTSQLDISNAAGTGTIATFIEGGAVELYHNNVKKFETVANGVYITGDLTASGVINLTSNVNVSVNSTTSNTTTVQNILTVNGNTILGDASTDTVIFNATANSNLIPTSNVTYNLGNTTNQWASVFSNNINSTTTNANTVAFTYANQSTSSTTLATIVQTAIATFSATTYGSAEVTITAKQGTSRHITKLLIVHDGTTAYATEYGSMLTGSSLATYDVDISTGNVRILATSASTSSTTYNVVLTLINA